MGPARQEATFDILVVGSGIAGLTAALTAAPRARVGVLTKGSLEGGATSWAQGGIAAAVGDDDSTQLHFEDTVTAGRGLCDERAVRVLVEEAPARVRDLTTWGVAFDRDRQGGASAVGREAAHSRQRILHAGGDATGAAIEAALASRLRQTGATLLEHRHLVRLLADDDGRCCAAEVRDSEDRVHRLGAGAVILASGGAGRLWRSSTNPPSALGEGVAVAWEAGAEVAGMEFMQFHPTALALSGAPRFLISEAMRGEGAHVVDGHGERFLFEADPLGELAGRDIVAAAIWDRLLRNGTDHVLLDCRPLGAAVRERFPTITETCRHHGIDITTDLVPIAPAAHYLIGGVRTDLDGASSVAGLFACGEVASTGVHGANRLASNSLLEGVVFGRRAALGALEDIAERPARAPAAAPTEEERHGASATLPPSTLADAMWAGCGLVRDAAGLQAALDTVTTVAQETSSSGSLEEVSLHQSATTASLVARAALLRQESRGAQVRTDFPSTRDSWHGVLVMHKQRGHHLDRNP